MARAAVLGMLSFEGPERREITPILGSASRRSQKPLEGRGPSPLRPKQKPELPATSMMLLRAPLAPGSGGCA
eukprot:4237390-Pyramimonas_sp.AAC.1